MIFVIVAGVPVFRFTAGNPAELVLSSDTIQKVYYPETKPTILIFKTKKGHNRIASCQLGMESFGCRNRFLAELLEQFHQFQRSLTCSHTCRLVVM